jgi:hypothetical protein
MHPLLWVSTPGYRKLLFILNHICTEKGGPHMVTQDDIYNGYLIPKGTTIIANIWFGFLFLEIVCVLTPPVGVCVTMKGLIRTRSNSTRNDFSVLRQSKIPVTLRLALGGGEIRLPSHVSHVSHCLRLCRICPGLTLANDEFYISVTQILAAFTISNATDQYGKAVGQDWKYCSGAVRFVIHFPVASIANLTHCKIGDPSLSIVNLSRDFQTLSLF